MFFSIPGEMVISRPRRRVRVDDLVSIRWPRNAWRRRSFPEPVILMRFLAPLSVFILGMSTLLLRFWGRDAHLERRRYFCGYCGRGARLVLYNVSLGLSLLVRAQHHDHVATVELGGRFNLGDIDELLDDTVQDLLAQLGVRGFAPTEHDGDLHLVTFGQELLNEACLGVEVTGSDLRPVLHLLDAHV